MWPDLGPRVTADAEVRLERARRNLTALEASPHREVLGKQIAVARDLVTRLEVELAMDELDAELLAVAGS